jgi:hypothetical protein
MSNTKKYIEPNSSDINGFDYEKDYDYDNSCDDDNKTTSQKQETGVAPSPTSFKNK